MFCGITGIFYIDDWIALCGIFATASLLFGINAFLFIINVTHKVHCQISHMYIKEILLE